MPHKTHRCWQKWGQEHINKNNIRLEKTYLINYQYNVFLNLQCSHLFTHLFSKYLVKYLPYIIAKLGTRNTKMEALSIQLPLSWRVTVILHKTFSLKSLFSHETIWNQDVDQVCPSQITTILTKIYHHTKYSMVTIGRSPSIMNWRQNKGLSFSDEDTTTTACQTFNTGLKFVCWYSDTGGHWTVFVKNCEGSKMKSNKLASFLNFSFYRVMQRAK